MSRNLCRQDCARCRSAVRIVGKPYRLEASHGRQQAKFAGTLVADAECPVCGARYTAWMWDPERAQNPHVPEWAMTHGFNDLSFRQSFNDEPGPGDLPDVGTVEVLRVVKIGGRVVLSEPLDRLGGY